MLRMTGIVLVVALAGVLSGCVGPGLTIPPESARITTCPPRAEPYPVADIPRHAPVPCDIAGETLVFPNGDTVEAPFQGGIKQTSTGSAAGPGNQYALMNFGTFGMIAGELDVVTCKSTWWGTDEGLSRYWAAFGKKVLSDEGGVCGLPN
jgi:hypothetical protein